MCEGKKKQTKKTGEVSVHSLSGKATSEVLLMVAAKVTLTSMKISVRKRSLEQKVIPVSHMIRATTVPEGYTLTWKSLEQKQVDNTYTGNRWLEHSERLQQTNWKMQSVVEKLKWWWTQVKVISRRRWVQGAWEASGEF